MDLASLVAGLYYDQQTLIMNSSTSAPWYKHFWPWFLIAVPTSSLIVGSMVIYLANTTSDSLVVDDYYKEGKAINANLDKEIRAKYLNISTDLLISEGGSVRLQFHSGIPKTGEALTLNLYHVTLKDRDMQTILTRDANGIYRGTFEQQIEGKWQASLLPFDQEWKIQQTVYLPQARPFAFNP